MITRSRDITVDRLVPLQEAWQSGAWRWDARTRAAFANELTYDGTLVAASKRGVTKRQNREPQSWLPPKKQRCQYATSWLGVKVRWSLTMDPSERNALGRTLKACGWPQMLVPGSAKITLGTPPVAPPSDRRYDTCAEMLAAGLGPYLRGRDGEYAWYRDDDADGEACGSYENVQLYPSTDWRTERYVTSTTPSISAPASPVSPPSGTQHRGYLHARILQNGTQIWRTSHPTPVSNANEMRRLEVPAGLLNDGRYVLQTWSDYDNLAGSAVAADAVSNTFIVDTTPPPAPEVAGVNLDGRLTVTATSSAADIAALLFTTNGRPPVRVPVAPGQAADYTPDYKEGAVALAWVNAVDRAGHLSPMTSIPGPPS